MSSHSPSPTAPPPPAPLTSSPPHQHAPSHPSPPPSPPPYSLTPNLPHPPSHPPNNINNNSNNNNNTIPPPMLPAPPTTASVPFSFTKTNHPPPPLSHSVHSSPSTHPPPKRRRLATPADPEPPLKWQLPSSMHNASHPSPPRSSSETLSAPHSRSQPDHHHHHHHHHQQQPQHNSPTHSAEEAWSDAQPNHSPDLHPQTNPSSTQSHTNTQSHPTQHQNHTPTPVRQPSVHPSPSRERRIWTRRALSSSGISEKLLNALDIFMTDLPKIPIQPDHSKRPTRNMRGWIQQLENPQCDPIWAALTSVLLVDNTPTTVFAIHWDHDLCRYILGRVVSANQTSKTRQAINNAIKRELVCRSESGSTRGKTFRDLFREKCHKARVQLGPLEDKARPKRAPHLPPVYPLSTRHHTTAVTDATNPYPPPVDGSSFSRARPAQSDYHPNMAHTEPRLRRLRESCPHKDEWGHTAWWTLQDENHIRLLPTLLVDHNLYELRNLLIDFRWIMRTFRSVDFSHGMPQTPTEGYDVILRYAASQNSRLPLVDIESFRLVRNALMVILPVLSQDQAHPVDQSFHAHLATQIVGRLLSLKRRFPTIASLIQSVELHAPTPWLKPLTRCFQQPRTDIALAVPSEGIFRPHQIVLSHDGRFLVTANVSIRQDPVVSSSGEDLVMSGVFRNGSREPTAAKHQGVRKLVSITIWDVHSGKQVGEVGGIKSHVVHLAITRDNNCIIGETNDGLFFWHFETGETWRLKDVHKATPRLKGLSSIKPTTKPQLVLTTHKLEKEPLIALWDTQTGSRERMYSSVSSKPNCIDVSSKMEFFASGHDNGFIHLWNWKDDKPILTFRDEGTGKGSQQVVSLSEANSQRDPDGKGQVNTGTISISFFERDNDLLLASVSWNPADRSKIRKTPELIRIWLLPPRRILADDVQSFVSCKRTAVWQSPRVREVYWSTDGNLFTGGDDGVARMWEQEDDDTWKQYTMEKDVKSERPLNMASAFISCGKQTKFVATYVTKSPYVVVWDTTDKELCRKIMKRTGFYRPYFPLLWHSVDVSDMQELQSVKSSKNVNDFADYGKVGTDAVVESRHEKGSRTLWQNPKLYFSSPDEKGVKRLGELQPWLTMAVGAAGKEDLRVCFDQPVRHCYSGTFVIDKGGAGLQDITSGVDPEDDKNEAKGKQAERRGIVVKLENGCVEFFELQGNANARLSPGSGEPEVDKITPGEGNTKSNSTTTMEKRTSERAGNPASTGDPVMVHGAPVGVK
ncbi:hypothetical protein BWQ96_04468 [Gracilariopsis chorda]|uniref:Uncharacterized protein n=1 Tax=Gracilariopsis chorda TaxID=448386 RepID=A0A2V3IX35_9FLOR|nr:hypothetical protein BWQ96_04468 [Gracilariopsis chorda]|eukprot:PXF45700.1 hypothetical protein BWQ96_04468 [Gracilariopsis chorda]